MRNLSAAALAVIESGDIRPLDLVKIEYDDATVAVHSGVGTLVYDGVSFLGVGQYGGISSVSEDNELQAANVTLALSGVDPNLISQALGTDWQGRLCTIYRAFLDSSYAVIIDPIVIFKGRLDQQNITMGSTARIDVVVENLTSDWQRSRVARFNNAEQQRRFAGDKGLQFVEQATDKPIYWGVAL